ncbi:hypothetical protein PHYPSEUDO_000816 [Phytophthora pseudosyringae]|uniref:Uncharacterized protein n=1 Tax=Phytophthora pseudosyringae TaxID=221518 RepID=A0A8T1WIQ6_9STRA|nr:hypothetical protein PHYPSEUDO_000816 [Phytophthora pseudosyringae]
MDRLDKGEDSAVVEIDGDDEDATPPSGKESHSRGVVDSESELNEQLSGDDDAVSHGQMFDSYGIPLDVAHNKRRHTDNAWKRGLCNTSTTTNAISHFRHNHKNHKIAIAAEKASTTRELTKIERSNEELKRHIGMRKAEPSTVLNATPRRCAKNASVVHLFRPSHELISTMISKWLMAEGLPYNMTQAETFNPMMHVVAGDTSFGVLSRDSYDAAINARFDLFVKAVVALLNFNADTMLGLKFVNGIHEDMALTYFQSSEFQCLTLKPPEHASIAENMGARNRSASDYAEAHQTEDPAVTRPDQCRANQARYCQKQLDHAKSTDQDVQKLHADIELQSNCLLLECPVALSLVEDTYSTSNQVNDNAEAKHQLAFLRSSMAKDVNLGEHTSVEELMEQWKLYSSSFPSLYLQLERIQHTGHRFVSVTAMLNVGVSETTLQKVFPHLTDEAFFAVKPPRTAPLDPVLAML